MKKNFIVPFVLGVILLVGQGVSRADIINGDFSDGLTGWSTDGSSVTVENGVAVLTDNGPFFGLLYQIVPFVSGSYSLEFDYNILSIGPAVQIDENTFTPPDVFQAALYFSDVPNVPDYATGTSLVMISGTSGPIPSGWQHFAISLNNEHGYIVPYFSLFDYNWVVDSTVYIDNVGITASVPEPGMLLLLGTGLVGLIGLTRRSLFSRS